MLQLMRGDSENANPNTPMKLVVRKERTELVARKERTEALADKSRSVNKFEQQDQKHAPNRRPFAYICTTTSGKSKAAREQKECVLYTPAAAHDRYTRNRRCLCYEYSNEKKDV